MSWSTRMNLAIEYIEDNLKGELNIEAIAHAASSSKFHFHRMFYARFGFTVTEYVRRRRLTLAAAELVAGKQRIIDIASMYGYDSPNAFTRAFRQVHGINPSKARASHARLTTYNRVSYPVDDRGAQKLNYRIVEKPAFTVVGKSKTFDFDEFVKSGPKFWKEYVTSDEYKSLWELTHGRTGKVSEAPLMSVYFPEEAEDCNVFLDVLGLEPTADLDIDGFEVFTIPAATYAEFSCSYHASMKTNRYIYGEWFSSTGYERDGNKPDIAAYFPIAFRPMKDMGVRWWIPVSKK